MDSDEEDGWVSDEADEPDAEPDAEPEAAEAEPDPDQQEAVAGAPNPSTILDLILLQ